jgi:hypothetical protein
MATPTDVIPMINYGILRGELLNDPLGLGYSGNISTGNDGANVSVLNALTGSGVAAIFRNDIQPREVVNAVQPADFTALTQIQLSKLNLLFVNVPIDATKSGTRQNFQNVFSGSTTLLSGFLGSGVSQRPGARSEVLFGCNVLCQGADVSQALRHTSGGLPASGYPFTQ